jgi:predicted metal-dependent hydrolase
VRPVQVRIQSTTRKWASCSVAGRVTFSSDLLTRGAGFQDYVIVHELLHLRVRNHGRLFKALMSVHVPHWRRYSAD